MPLYMNDPVAIFLPGALHVRRRCLSGQRISAALYPGLIDVTSKIKRAPSNADPQPFMGAVISARAAASWCAADAVDRSGRQPLLE